MIFFQGTLNILGSSLAIFSWNHYGDPGLILFAFLTAAMGGLTILLGIKRPLLFSDRGASLLFVLNVMPVYGMIWSAHAILADAGKYWVPFQTHNLSGLTIAILAPKNPLLGSLSILLFPVLAVFQYETYSSAQLAWLPLQPLIAPVAFAAFALVLYFFRLRGMKLSEIAAEKEAEAQTMRKLARTILAIKDLANSPIQTLSLDIETLKRKYPEAAPIIPRLEKSTHLLKDLNHILDEKLHQCINHSGEISIDPSFDPHGELRQ